ncbi:BTAD domain-containing putative transcriptional regulator [Streptomyces sp. NPDC050145]|uniref:AfsR/SARP family transcriptional regulator n=1 Tax=Streptomyces sp. NPDC050145 TaxID=3365602 RepID=UPI0037B266BE
MEFRLLGTVGVATGGGELPLGPAKRRSLLAALLLRPNTAVPLDQLIDALWPEGPPARARTVTQGHVSRLRALLAQGGADEWGVQLVTRGDAYVLEMPESLLDAHRFDELVRLAHEQRSPDDAAALLREALSLWRGPALVGVATGGPLRVAADGLEQARISAVEHLARTYGEFGEHARAAALLHAEAVAHPMRESLAAALMRSLYRAGRQSDAIDQYHRTRTLLADELGVDPGPALREAYAEILAGDGPGAPPTPPKPQPAPEPAAPEPVRATAPDGPDLLPRPPRGFVGRDRELAALDAAAGPEHAVTVLTGPAGVGKTAAALHWAHTVRDRYDGVLFTDLRGFSDDDGSGDSAPETADVLREFLIALGVPARDLPETPGALAAAYRTRTEHHRHLVVLDNARTAAQVRPLLPAGPGSAAVVTSRLRLDGLAVSELARTVALGVLDPAGSAALLAAATGAADRLAAEPEAAARLTELCAGLPLALRVVAARVNARPEWPLSGLAEELADEQRRLALLDVDDTGVAAALRLTLRALPEDARLLFHRLGVLPGPDLDRYAAAALTDRSPQEAATALDRLAGAHLLTEPTPGRYLMHDLVRLYARGLARADDTEATDEALVRLLDHYVRTALHAAAVTEPDDRPCCVLPADIRPDLGRPALTDRTSGLAWYSVERENLVAAAVAAHAAGHDDRAWRLAVLQWPYVVGYVRDDWVPLMEQGLAAAQRLDDPDAESRIRALYGWVLTEEGRLAQAIEQLERAPELAARAGDTSSEATALVNLAVALDRDGGPSAASLAHVVRAAELARATDDILTELLALEHRAGQLLATADHAAVLDCTERGLALPGASAEGLAPLRQILLRIARGTALHALGREAEALDCLHEARDEAVKRGFEDGMRKAKAQLERIGSETATGR